jgi:hypothetical protein
LTDPRWKRIGSKSVMEAAATPHASRAKLTTAASNATIARVTLLERRTATPSTWNVTRLTGKAWLTEKAVI